MRYRSARPVRIGIYRDGSSGYRPMPISAIADRPYINKRRSETGGFMIRILIADDHAVVRSGLRTMLDTRPHWEVVAEAADGKEAILKAIETTPDIAVIDYSLPLINGIEVTRQIRARLPKTEVLIFTMHDNETLIQDVMKVGARGYLLKSDAGRDLLSAIDALAVHKPFFTAKVSETLLESYVTASKSIRSTLTNREMAIVQMVAE